jgi:alanine dehydrogenase
MKIGVPKEVKEDENRVAVTPSGAKRLAQAGHTVIVENGAGMGSGYLDEEYQSVGAILQPDVDTLYQEAEMIIKVKEPQPQEWGRLHSNQILFTYLHLAAEPKLTRALMDSGCAALGYETLQRNGRLPLLEPMSEIAGRMSPLMGAYFLGGPRGGKGVLLCGSPGSFPGQVLIIGGGSAGFNAARVAIGLGADVTIMEIDFERVRQLENYFPKARVLYSDEDYLLRLLPTVDLLICAALIPGAKAPRLVHRSHLKMMKPGSVIVDIAIDQGGCAETSRPTSHRQPVYVEEQIIHYCVTNMPGAYARTSTQALTHVTLPYIEKIAGLGVQAACDKYPEIASSINVQAGSPIHPAAILSAAAGTGG